MRRWVPLACVLLASCAGAEPAEDFAEPTPSDDAELPEGADVPLLPPNEGDDDASVSVEDAPSRDDVALDGSTTGDASTRDASPVRDAAVSRDVVTARDAAVVRDAPAASDVPPPRCTGSASGQSAIWTCTADRAARQRCVSGRVETVACAHGCIARPSGTNDDCAPAPPPAGTLPACAHRALLHSGLHPDASDRLRCAGVPAARITQTIGYATASAGTHAPDGTAGGSPYSAATDISVRGLTQTELRTLLGRLADQGFAAWYRWPGHDGWPSSESPHIHAVYTGCRMKASLQAQVRDWLVGRNGLASHTTYTFTTWSAAQRALIRAVFDRYN